MTMFTIKMCGITSVADAVAAAAAGADAVGLNFYPHSPRFVSTDLARAIGAALPPEIVKVGVFVNAEPAAVRQTADELGLDLIQLHGDEPPEVLARLGDRPVMKVFRPGPAGLQPIKDYLEHCRRLGCLPRLVLFDALVAGEFGGTGEGADWALTLQYRNDVESPPLVLAGGLTAENVGLAIMATGATAVDVASGVESSPGRKDPIAMARFVESARAACAANAARIAGN
jgi:phosphoribosylanthranilate isomerase